MASLKKSSKSLLKKNCSGPSKEQMTLRKKGRLSEAIEVYQKCLTLAPADVSLKTAIKDTEVALKLKQRSRARLRAVITIMLVVCLGVCSYAVTVVVRKRAATEAKRAATAAAEEEKAKQMQRLEQGMDSAKSSFYSIIRKIDATKLRQYGGSQWQAVSAIEEQAKSLENQRSFRLASEKYREASRAFERYGLSQL